MALNRGKRLELPGRITIGRWTGQGEQEIRVAITDDISGTRVCEFRIGLQDFAEVMTGRGEVAGALTVYQNGVWGKTHETKQQPVLVPNIPWTRGANREHHEHPDVAKALAPYEVDGWVGSQRDAVNFTHRSMRWEGGRLYENEQRYAKGPQVPFDDQVYARPEDGQQWVLVGFHRHVDKAD